MTTHAPTTLWETVPAPALTNPVDCLTLQNGILAPFSIDKIEGRRRSVSGAVYDQKGRLVVASQRRGGIGGDLVLSEDPERITTPVGTNHLSGTWLYGGHWMGHFGHFIIETLTTLWSRKRVDGIIFHPFIFGSEIHEWQRTLVRRLGFHVPIMVAGQGCVVEELIVPERPFTLNHSVAPEAVGVWNRLASPGTCSSRVFLSRSRLTTDSRSVPGDERLDALMSSLGFNVIHPQELNVEGQLDMVAAAAILAGVAGSALHLSVFAHPHCKVLELGDRRTPDRPMPNQRVLDDAVGRPSGFVPFYSDGEVRDICETERTISALLS